MNCPCCGQPVTVDRPLVDLPTNLIKFRGRELLLHPRGAEIADVLAGAYPAGVTKDDLIRRVWGPHPPRHEHKVNEHVGRLRWGLAPVGLTVTTATSRASVTRYALREVTP